MPNSIEYAEKYQGFIDEELEHRSYTEWMTPNDDAIEYTGGKDIKIAQLDVSGLGNYSASGTSHYPDGTVTMGWKTYTMEMDRAVRFELGRLDPSDSNFIVTTENVTREFARKRLVPEQDIYRFNRMYNALKAKTAYASHLLSLSSGLTAENAVSSVTGLFTQIKEDANEDLDFVCFMAMKNEQVFRAASKQNHHDLQFGKTVSINGYSYRCMLCNELPVIFVPSKRLQTVIKVNDGRTKGQEAGGIVADTTSEQIEFLITSSDAAIAAGKIDSLKLFTADENQTGDEALILYHYLYDCWVLDNQVASLGAAVVKTKTESESQQGGNA